jgi:hypothetical protein
MAFHRGFTAGFYRSRKPSFENVKSHDVSHGVMQDQGEEIKVDNAMEALGQVVKKSGEVAMPGNGFGNFEQGFELTPRMFERRCAGYFGRGDSGIRHRVQNSIRVGRGSTKRTGISETAEATPSPTRVYYFRVARDTGGTGRAAPS